MPPKLSTFLILLCLICLLLPACTRKTGTAEAPQPRLQEDRFRPLTLEPYWSNDLKLAPGERIEQVWLSPQSIYCLTSLNMLHRLDRDTGITTWIRQPTEPPRHVYQPVEADGKTAVIAHNIVKVRDTQTGKLLWEYALPFTANSAPAFDGEFLYIPDSVDRLRAVEVGTGQELWSCRAQEAITARPALLEGLLVAVAESGEVLAYDTTTRALVWPEHFHTRGAIFAEPLLTLDGRCYVAGTDKMLYCLISGSGDQVWRYFAGSALHTAPQVADGRVFLNVPRKGLVVLDHRDGSELDGFKFPDGKQYLGTVNNVLYIVTDDRQILSVDPQTGSRLAAVSAKDFDFFLTNNQTPRIYLANSVGRVVCLQKLGSGPLSIPGPADNLMSESQD